MDQPLEAAHRTVLNVQSSATGKRWCERLSSGERQTALAIAQHYGLPDGIARILAGRGVSLDDAETFLNPTLRDLLPDPHSLTDMEQAATRLADAITTGEAIAIFGDYDVDGATSSAILFLFLKAAGAGPVDIHIPDRILEGYGPNIPALDDLHARGAKLLVTVDCGTVSFEALAHARTIGLDAVVIDHHLADETLPEAVAIVNPNRLDDLSGQGHLAGVGVTFLLIVAINRILRARGWFASRKAPDLRQWLDLVALGTVCDVVPLQGLNRAYVVRGLEVMRQRYNHGLAALADKAKISGPLSPYHLGFLLGPRINAGGRIGNAGLGATLLTTKDPIRAETIAEELDQLNRERQTMESIMLEEAVAVAEKRDMAGELGAVLIAESEEWHAGIVGLLASRLKDRFHRPSFAITFDQKGVGSGSGRSIPGVDLGSAVRQAVEAGLLVKGGGHAMAAGLTIAREKLAEFECFLTEHLATQVSTAQAAHALKIDSPITAEAASIALLEQIEQAGPYGAGHPEPVFVFPAHRVLYADVIKNGHIRLTIGGQAGGSLKGIAFRAADTELGRLLLDARGHYPIHVAGALSLDTWQGTKRVQLRVLDAASIS